jgi:hypothetical protein
LKTLTALLCCVFLVLAIACCLILSTLGGRSDAVDVYNSATGTWSTAQLSVAREIIAATSVGDVALFAGGYAQGKSLRLW